MTHHTDADKERAQAMAEKHGATSYRNRADTQNPAYGFTQIQLAALIADVEQAARRAPVVPTEITYEMSDAGLNAYNQCTSPFRRTKLAAAFNAMLAAAPKPPEAEENPLQEQLDEALQSLEFYKRRCDLLQSIQHRMRDPERTMVCDVLANGHLLQGGDGQPDKSRYAPPEAAPVQLPEPTAYLYHDAPTLEDYIANERAGIPINSACIGVKRMPHCRNETPLYTEQQVRQLLATHGIK